MRASRVAILAAVVWIVGCGPKVTPIGPGFVYQPNAREQRLWDSSKEMSTSMQGGGAIYHNPELQAYVQSVLHRVLGQNEKAYIPLEPRVILFDCPAMNAFTLPQGDIYVHTGILGRMRSEAQLAMLLGHEVTHATHRHSYQETEERYATTGTNSYIAVISAVGGRNIHSLMSGLSQVVMLAAVSGYSRDKEEEADKVGLTLIAQAGYDPSEGAKMFEGMVEGADKDEKWNFFYSDHPKMESRVRCCKQLLSRLPPALVAQAKDMGRDRYLDKTIALIHQEVRHHVAQGKYVVAEKTLTYLADARPTDATTFALLGDLYRARAGLGDGPKAKEAYQKALEVDNRRPDAHKGLGYALARDGDKAPAVEHLNAFLQLSPTAADVPYVRDYVSRLSQGAK